MYRDDVEALQARHAALEAEVAERVQARDEVARMLAEARAREDAERRLADLAAGGPARRRRRLLLIAAVAGVLTVAVLGAYFRLTVPERDRVEEAIGVFSGFVDRMCDCRDTACTQKIYDDMNRWAKEMAGKEAHRRPPPDITAAQKERLNQLATRFSTCSVKAAGVRD
jgi:hypothetical protein